MAQDFRASQLRTAKIIASGSSAGGAQLVFYSIDADSTVTPGQGTINTAAFSTASIGSDVFLYVSGTVATGSSTSRISVFGGSVKVSGSLGFNNGIWIQQSGNDLKFYDVSNPDGWTLSQLATSGSAGGGSGGGSLQQAYLTGSTITSNATTGSVIIAGDPGNVSASLVLAPTNTSERALHVMNAANDTQLILVHGIDSTFGGAGIVFRSNGGFNSYIGWQDGSSALSQGETSMAASAYYDDQNDRLRLQNRNSGGKFAIWNPSADLASLEFVTNFPAGTAYFFPNQSSGIVHNSGTLIQSGVAKFYEGLSGSLTKLNDGTSYLIEGSNVTITTNSNGSVTIAASAGGGSSVQWVEGSPSPRLRTTASVAVGSGSRFAEDFGENVFFAVSGSNQRQIDSWSKVAVLPDTVFSGGLFLQQTPTLVAPIIRFITSGGSDFGKITCDTAAVPNTPVIILTNDFEANGLFYISGANLLLLDAARTVYGDLSYGVGTTFGTDVFFHVSGAIDGKGGSTKTVAQFGGDTVVSGNFYVGNSATIHKTTTTTNATPATIWTLSLSASAVYDVDVSIVAVGTASTITRRFKRNLAALTSGSTAAIMENTVFAPVLDVSGSTAASTFDVGFTVSASNLLTTVTGAASQNVKWTMKAEYTWGGNI